MNLAAMNLVPVSMISDTPAMLGFGRQSLERFAEREGVTLDPNSVTVTVSEPAYLVPGDDDEGDQVVGESFARIALGRDLLPDPCGYMARWEGEAS